MILTGWGPRGAGARLADREGVKTNRRLASLSLARLLALVCVALGALALGMATLSGCTAQAGDEPLGFSQQAVSPPSKAYCTIPVTGKGTKNMEEDYLPHVIQCENGGANLQALKAQAIAARSVAYYAMATKGSICDGQGCQVYSCGATPNAKQIQAVKETAGMYLSYGGMLTYGFYVNGDSKTAPPSCKGSSSVSIEKYITYNEGKTGTNVQQTSLGYIGPPGYGQNRGCMGQWGARCLENNKGYDYKQILQFYYGKDIKILTATGSCVTPVDTDGDGVPDSKDNCKTVKNAGQKDTDSDGKGDACDGDDDGDGVADAKDNCPVNKNAGQLDTDSDGKGDACDGDDDGDGVKDAMTTARRPPTRAKRIRTKTASATRARRTRMATASRMTKTSAPTTPIRSKWIRTMTEPATYATTTTTMMACWTWTTTAHSRPIRRKMTRMTTALATPARAALGAAAPAARAVRAVRAAVGSRARGGSSQQTKLLDSGDEGGCSVRALPVAGPTGAAMLLLARNAGVLSRRRRR